MVSRGKHLEVSGSERPWVWRQSSPRCRPNGVDIAILRGQERRGKQKQPGGDYGGEGEGG